MSTPAAAMVSADPASHRHDQHQYLTFMLGREAFALGILSIKEILEYSPPTEIPMMPPYIRGVVNLRGAAVPVVDLCARFNRASTQVTKKTCIVIVETSVSGQRYVIGVLVDAVNEVLEIPNGEIEPPPSFGATIRADFIEGMGKVRGKFVIILDLDRIISAEEIEAASERASTIESSATESSRSSDQPAPPERRG